MVVGYALSTGRRGGRVHGCDRVSGYTAGGSMSRQNELNLYIRRVQERLRLGAWVRGAAILMAAALFTTLVLVVILNAYAFPGRGMTGARLALVVVLGLTGGFAVAWPVVRLNRRRSVATAEAASPELEQRLTTFSEKEKLGNDPF